MKRRTQIILYVLLAALLAGYVFYNEYIKRPVMFTGSAAPSFKWYSYDVPNRMDFAGEAVPLSDPEVIERFDKELHINAYWNSNTIFLIKRANKWFPLIEKVLKEEGVPDDFKYLALIESGLVNGRSGKGAVGFWQLLDGTAKELGLEVTEEVDERFDPEKSTRAACKYLKKAYARFDNWTNVAASYNMGMFGLHRSMTEQDVDSYYDILLNEETARYVFRILAMKEIMEDPKAFGYLVPKRHLYEMEDLREVEITESVEDFVTFAAGEGINYKILKQYNPWLRKPKLTVNPGKVYTILIPENPPRTIQLKDLKPIDSLEENELKMSGEN